MQPTDNTVTMNIPVQEADSSPQLNPQETTQPQTEAPKTEISPQKKNPVGPPCLYCQDKERLQKIATDYIELFENSTKPSIPFIEELALRLRKHRETILNWKNKKNENGEPEHPQLIDTVKRIESFQRLMLLKRTLGRYNPTGAIFQLKANHGFMEAEKRIIAGEVNEPITIQFIPEQKIPDNE